MPRTAASGLTDIGKRRKINQDALFLDEEAALFAVADGMGGHNAGEVASRMVVDSFRNTQADAETGRDAVAIDKALSSGANRLLSAIQRANQEVHKASREVQKFRGMGSTVSAICLGNGSIACANVGDSPVFLIRGNSIEELSRQHNLAAEQEAEGSRLATLRNVSLNHILTRAIGIEESVTVRVCELQAVNGDILVIGSDGLSNKVAREEIRKAAQAMPPEEACRHLVTLANERGGEDNITVVIVRIISGGDTMNPILAPFRRLFGFAGKHRITEREV